MTAAPSSFQPDNRHPVETLWREVGLPEYFLGNDGSNTKLYALYDATIEECAKIADSRAVKLRAKAKAQALPSRQWYFAQAIEARVIADLIRACRTSQLSRPQCWPEGSEDDQFPQANPEVRHD